MTIVATVVLAHRLGPAGFGRYALLAFLLPVLVSVSDLGFSGGLMQRGATAYGRGDRFTIERGAGQALTWALLRWPALFVVGALLLRDSTATALYGIVSVVSIACSGVGMTLLSTVRGGELARVVLLGGSLNAITTIVMALARQTPSQIFAAGLAAQSCGLAVQIVYLRADRAAFRASFRPQSLAGTKPDFRFGATAFGGSQLAEFALSRSELLFFSSHQQAARGTYAAAWTTGNRLTLPLDALYGSLAASLTAVPRAEGADMRAVQRSLRLSAALFVIAAGPALLLAFAAARLLFPSSFHGVTTSTIVLAASALAVSSVNPLIAIYFASRRAKPQMVAAAAALAVNVGLSILLIPPYGLTGAVISNCFGALVYVVVLALPLLHERTLRSDVRDYVCVAGPPVVVGALIAVAVSLIDTILVTCIAGLILALVQPVLVSRIFRPLYQSDIDAIRQHLGRDRWLDIAIRTGLLRARPDRDAAEAPA
jgi:O-antigen/teichoic acid export membrane protein